MKTSELQINIYKIVTFVLQGHTTLSNQSATFDHGFWDTNEMEDFMQLLKGNITSALEYLYSYKCKWNI